MRFKVEPLSGIGPARLGVPRDELRAAMNAVSETFRKVEGDRWETDAYFGGGFQVFYGGHEPRVEFIELSRSGGMVALFEGLDVFGTPAAELIARLDRRCPYDRNDPEIGYSYIFRDWELALWRPVVPEGPGDDEGRYFSTIGVGVRGYFDDEAR